MGPSLLADITCTHTHTHIAQVNPKEETLHQFATRAKQVNSRVPGVALRPRLRLPGVDVGEDIVAEMPAKQGAVNVTIVGSVFSQAES